MPRTRGERRNRSLQEKWTAGDRLGKTPAEWLAWVLKFSGTNLDSLRQGERDALGEDLRLLPTVMMETKTVTVTTGDPLADVGIQDAMPERVLRDIQSEISAGMNQLMKPGGSWEVPGQETLLIFHDSPRGAALTRFTALWSTEQNEKRSILAAVGRLLLDHGEKVRWCLACDKSFVATRRQAYCSTLCSQRVRNQRRKEKEG